MSLRAAIRARRALPQTARSRSEQGASEQKMRLPGSLSSVPGLIQRTDTINGSEDRSSNTARAQVCGRENKKVSDFPNTYIERVSIDLGRLSSGMQIHWNRPTPETRSLPSRFPISPGAGLCNLCCNEAETSQDTDTLCTPKGNSEINRYACQLQSTSWAKNASFFEPGDSRSGIAIHSGKDGHVPSFPASHGCVRTTDLGSAVVWDNSSSRSIREEPAPTQVQVSGTWDGNRCYPSVNGERRSRTAAERCNISSRTGALAPQPNQRRVAIDDIGTGPGADDLAGPV